MKRLLQPDDTFVNVGANLGQSSLLATRRVGPTGRFFAIEPNPAAFRHRWLNLALNPTLRIEIIEAAASDHTFEVRLAHPEDWNLGACASR